jgi:hypothetical protein
MSLNDSPRPVRVAAVAALIVLLSAAGCGDGVGKTYSVSGKVTIDGAPLKGKSATVMFVPIRDKGNSTTFEPGGTIDSSGNYTLYTKGQRGAPAGWYKVVVTGVSEEPPEATVPLTKRPAPKSLVPARYGQASTTPLEVEVVASPASGAYDLDLKP